MMKSMAEQLKPLKHQVTGLRVMQHLHALSRARLRKMLTDTDKHVVPYRGRIYAELQRRKAS